MTPQYRFLEVVFRILNGYMKDRVTGVENVPHSGGYIAASNHLSLMDGLFVPQVLVSARMKPVHFVSYSELFDIPVVGVVLRWAQGIVLERSTSEGIRRALDDCKKVLVRGEGVGMFPEAHIARPEKMRRARTGAALLALETGCPVLPIGVIGTDRVMPRGTMKLHYVRRAVSMHIGKPMHFKQYIAAYNEGDEEARELIRHGVITLVMREIARLSNRTYPYGAEAAEKLPGYAGKTVDRPSSNGEN